MARSYAERRARTLQTYGLLPHQVTAIRKQFPAEAAIHDELRRLAKTDPDAARERGRELWDSLSEEKKNERFTVKFDGREQQVTNPLTWYH